MDEEMQGFLTEYRTELSAYVRDIVDRRPYLDFQTQFDIFWEYQTMPRFELKRRNL